MDYFDKILNDPEIIERYRQISINEEMQKGWARHDLYHVQNVAKIVSKILTDLKYDSQLISEAKIASILHDTGCIDSRVDHEIKGYEFAKKYIKKNDIKLQYKEEVLEAIKIHRDGFDTDNIIALTLILADKIDFQYMRMGREGYNIEGMKEVQYIKEVKVNIVNKLLKIQFICDNKINKSSLDNFYFITKIFKSIKSFAKKMKLEYIVLFNNDIWNI